MAPTPLARVALALAAALAAAAGARAADTEVRDFATRIDGKPAGDYHMTITRGDDGTCTMSGQADVRLTRLGITVYRYSYNGTEVWKGGRLVKFNSQSNDDGKPFTVAAWAEGDRLRVRANGQEQVARGDAWVTTYWQLPARDLRNGAVPLIEADNGQILNGRMQYLGSEQLTVGGRVQNCTHYRASGPNLTELWFDAQERLVKREWTEDGHRVVIELVRVRK